jgi:predicted metal-dependent phosphoesterase TrpH
MKIDLHIHSKDGSDGRWNLAEIFAEGAERRQIDLLSITDHDSIAAQRRAMELARAYGMAYITGVELNVTFSHPDYKGGKAISLDCLGYQFDIDNAPLVKKLETLRDYRKKRAVLILENLNRAFAEQGLPAFTMADLAAIEAGVDGAIGRPHIARYMVAKGIVATLQEAFDRYLVAGDVPKMPLSLPEASELIRGAGGKLILAHPNDPNGTSLVNLTSSVEEQVRIIRDAMMTYIDGIECWHSRHDTKTTATYAAFARNTGLIVSGGSDCHQHPVLMGEVDVPDYVGEQFLQGRHSAVRGARR